MSGPSVSVIIPAYRASGVIGRALDSLVGQTRPPEEILVVDDGSPDHLEAALEPFRGLVTLVRKPNGGAASARNLGIERARGDLIAFLDADDRWEPIKLERQIEVFRRHPEVGLVAGRFYHQEPGGERIDPSASPDRRKFGRFPEDRPVVASGEMIMRIATRVWTSMVVVRREALGDRRFDTGLASAEDRDLWIRLAAAHPAYMSSEPLATAILEPGSLSRSNVDVDFENMLRVIRRHGALLGPRHQRRWEMVFYRLWASCLLGQGQPELAFGPAWNRLRREWSSAEAWYILFKCAVLARRFRPAGR